MSSTYTSRRSQKYYDYDMITRGHINLPEVKRLRELVVDIKNGKYPYNQNMFYPEYEGQVERCLAGWYEIKRWEEILGNHIPPSYLTHTLATKSDLEIDYPNIPTFRHGALFALYYYIGLNYQESTLLTNTASWFGLQLAVCDFLLTGQRITEEANLWNRYRIVDTNDIGFYHYIKTYRRNIRIEFYL